MSWQPGRRSAQRALEDPFEDVPGHLWQPLWDWIFQSLFASGRRQSEIAVAMRVAIPDPRKVGTFYKTSCAESPEFMLDLVEALLERYGYDGGHAHHLKILLEEANSAYTVRDDWLGLEARVAPGVKELVAAAVDEAQGSAGDHLVNAWNGAYGRTTDPVKSYSEAIKAVEAALAPHVSPQNAKQTLGTMIADVRNKPEKWRFELEGSTADAGVETVLHMMRLLWDGQTSRHAGARPTRHETMDEARAAVHIAATLVQFGTSGAFAAR